MSYANYRITLDIRKSVEPMMICAKKGDTGRKVYITLSDGGKMCPLGPGTFAVFTGVKPDGTVLYNKTTVQYDRIVYEFTQQTTAVAGLVDCEVRVFDAASNLVTCPKLMIMVEDRLIPDGEIESKDEVTALVELMADINNAIKRCNDAADEGEAAAENANSAAGSAIAAAGNAQTAAEHASNAAIGAQEAVRLLKEARDRGEFTGPRGETGYSVFYTSYKIAEPQVGMPTLSIIPTDSIVTGNRKLQIGDLVVASNGILGRLTAVEAPEGAAAGYVNVMSVTSIKGEKGDSGITVPVGGFFTLAVDGNGDLWVYSEGDTGLEFEYDSETGNLYVVQEQG